MLEKSVSIVNKSGLHARPAAQFVQTALQFKSTIKVGKASREVDGKSILGVLSLGITKGTRITLKAEGEDEVDAIETMMALIENLFGEGME